MTAIRASLPPLARTKSLRMLRLRSLSSAPPMIIRGPRVGAEGMGRRLAPASPVQIRVTGLGGPCHSCRVPSPDVSPDARLLVLMRHAKAEAWGQSDFDRRLTERGRADAEAAGRWLAERG